jgi:16S rRNA (cytosine1402-N4)-methyltransferase
MEAQGWGLLYAFCLKPVNLGSSAYISMSEESSSRIPSNVSYHQPVLLKETIEFLNPKAGETFLDCTVGTGGHSISILPRLLPNGRIIAIDCDDEALSLAQKRLVEFKPNVEFIHDNFSHIPEILKHIGIEKVGGLIADLGISSLHVDNAYRGFSFSKEGPLDMRMDQQQTESAASLLRKLPEQELALLLANYGQERWARRIAKHIVKSRKKHTFRTTTELAKVISEAIPSRQRYHRIHPATRTFQALRMAVNNELAALEKLLEALPNVLLPGARAVIISFHSLEDRLVKHAFRKGEKEGIYNILTDKPVSASDDETGKNPRSRSAKLRAVERLA